MQLTVTTTKRWRVVVEQQVDTALREPLLPAMRSSKAKVIARASLYSIERASSGKALLYRLPNDRLALRMEDFKTSSNTDLFVWLSEARRPRTTKQASRAEHQTIRALKSTVGTQNYLLPRNLDVGSIRSVVIWCEPVQIAYAGASLRSSADSAG